MAAAAAAITDRLLFGKSAHRLEDEAAAWIMLVPLPLAGMRRGMRDSMAASVIVYRLSSIVYSYYVVW